ACKRSVVLPSCRKRSAGLVPTVAPCEIRPARHHLARPHPPTAIPYDGPASPKRVWDSPITPGAILVRQAHDQSLDLVRRLRPAGSPLLAPIVLLCNQSTMPGQQRLRRDDRAQLDQHLPSHAFCLCGQAPALVVGEAQSLPAQLLSAAAKDCPPHIYNTVVLLLSQSKPRGSRDLAAPSCIPTCKRCWRSGSPRRERDRE